MQKFFKYPSIKQFRNIVRDVEYNENTKQIKFERTVKLHGTNAAIVYNLEPTHSTQPHEKLYAQSRNNVITPENDNAGFAQWVDDNYHALHCVLGDYATEALGNWDNERHLVVYGEWCGKGIQKGTSINNCEKMFVVFDAYLVYLSDMSHPLTYGTSISRFEENPLDFVVPEIGMYNIHEFGGKEVTLDFTDPLALQVQLEKDAEEVGRECPVGLYFGHSGPGEGHVYNAVQRTYKFKVKSEAHKVTKTKVFNPEELEKITSVNAFVETTLREPRLEQGLEYLKEMGLSITEESSLGTYIPWVIQDVVKEEGDIATELGIDMKLLNKAIANKARKYFQSNSSIILAKEYFASQPRGENGLL